MTYITIRCPHCGAFCRQTTKKQYNCGTPLRTCVRCGKPYIDKYYHEVAIEGFGSTDKVRSVGWLLLPFAIGAFCGGYFLKTPLAYLIGGIITLLMLVFIYISSIDNKKKMERELQESEKRLMNKEYVMQLKQLGYYVPYSYLRDIKKEEDVKKQQEQVIVSTYNYRKIRNETEKQKVLMELKDQYQSGKIHASEYLQIREKIVNTPVSSDEDAL